MQEREGGSHGNARAIVLIGVSGSGKSTIGKALAPALGATFLEGDDFHSSANIAKMRAGQPLNDEDRHPWLETIGVAIARHLAQRRSVVVSCSALRRAYRDTLREAARHPLVFVHLTITPDILRARMNARQHHFMPSSLLESQLATLEPLRGDEDGTEVAETGTARQTVAAVERWLRMPRGTAHEKGRPPTGRPSKSHTKPRPIGGWDAD